MREGLYCLAIQTPCLCAFLQQGKGLIFNQAQIGSPLDANIKTQPLVVIVVNFVFNQGCCHHFPFCAIMTTMGTTRIIITTTTITNQTQRSIGLGFHYQQGLGRGGGPSSSLLSSLVAQKKKGNTYYNKHNCSK